jgi:hypothetical protein
MGVKTMSWLHKLSSRFGAKDNEPAPILTCASCGKVYRIGEDATVEKLERDCVTPRQPGRNFLDIYREFDFLSATNHVDEVSAIPDCVLLRRDLPIFKGELAKHQKLARANLKTLLKSLKRGEPRKWFCRTCGRPNDYSFGDKLPHEESCSTTAAAPAPLTPPPAARLQSSPPPPEETATTEQPMQKWSNAKIHEAIEDYKMFLHNLDLGNCNVSAEDIRQIFQMEDLTPVEDLSLKGNRIGSAGAAVLAGFLSKLTSIRRLQLEGNEIGDKGVEALASCLSGLSSLEVLCLNDNELGDAGAKALAGSLDKLKSLKLLELGHNYIGDAGANALAGPLGGLSSLNRLDLSDNRMGDAGVKVLAGCLNKRVFPYFFYGNNQVGWDENKKHREAQKSRLIDALKRADFRVGGELLGTPFSPTATEALFLACASTEIGAKAVAWLLEKGAEVNARGRLERTPLLEVVGSGSEQDWSETIAGKEGPLEKMQVLVAHGADLTAKEDHGLTPLAMARYLGRYTAVAMLTGTPVRTAWEEAHPIEASYEAMSKHLVREHGPLVRVECLSHWPKFEIKFHYQDGVCIYSGARTGNYDINFLSLGYVGQGPRYAEHFLRAAGFDLTTEEIDRIKAGDSIVLRDGKAVVVSAT